MKTDIAYIVSHGFAARMIIQTNLLGLLVADGKKKVALIAPDEEDDNLRTYCEKHGVDLYEFNPASNFWTSQYMEARKYFLEDIRKNPALWEKHIYATRFTKGRNPWRHIRPRLLMFFHNLRKWWPGLKDLYKRREEKQLESPEAAQLLEKIDPSVFISTYPVNLSEAMMLKAANEQGIKTVIHLLSWDNISCKGHFPALADEYIAWGPIMERELMEYYQIPKEKIHAQGVPHFDLHVRSRQAPNPAPYLKELGLDPSRPYLFFGMSSPRFAPKEIDIVEWLAKSVKEDVFGKDIQLIIRPHPQNVQGSMADQSWLPRLKALHSGRVRVDFPDLVKSKMPWSIRQKDMERLSQLLVGASISYNSGSTLSIDALMCGVPVVLTSFDGDAELSYWASARRLIDYTHLKKLIAIGGVSVVSSYEELTAVSQKYLEQPSFNMANRQKTIEEQCTGNEDFKTPVIAETIRAINNTTNERNNQGSYVQPVN
ncbi:MAG: hypothetical protein AAF990_08365 [Bacteroidota bacterium]